MIYFSFCRPNEYPILDLLIRQMVGNVECNVVLKSSYLGMSFDVDVAPVEIVLFCVKMYNDV